MLSVLIQDSSSLRDAVDRYGLPMAMLVVMILGLHRVLWPFLARQVEDNRKLLVKQADEAHHRLEVSEKAFLEALERRDKLMATAFKDLNARLDRDRLERKNQIPRKRT